MGKRVIPLGKPFWNVFVFKSVNGRAIVALHDVLFVVLQMYDNPSGMPIAVGLDKLANVFAWCPRVKNVGGSTVWEVVGCIQYFAVCCGLEIAGFQDVDRLSILRDRDDAVVPLYAQRVSESSDMV